MVHKCTHKWSWFAVVGIIENDIDKEWLNKHESKNPHRFYKAHKGFGFICGQSSLLWSGPANELTRRRYGEKFNKQDATMKVVLNMQQGTLSYIINEHPSR